MSQNIFDQVFLPQFAVKNLSRKDYDKATSSIEQVSTFQMVYDDKLPEICDKCGGRMYSHGSRSTTIADTVILGGPCKLILQVPRRRCKTCGNVWTPEKLEDVNDQHKMTERLYKKLAQVSFVRSFRDTAREYDVGYNTVKNVFLDFLHSEMSNVHFQTPAFLGLDEIKIKKIGEVTVITDLEHRTLYDMIEGRNQFSLTEYFKRIPNPEVVQWVCTDMYRPFEKTIRNALPNARWVIDHYHLVAYANRAMDKVRIEIQSRLSKRQRISTKKGLAYTLRTRTRNMTAEDASKLRECRKHAYLNDLMTAFDLKEDFFNIYDNNRSSKENAQEAFRLWEASIPKDKIFEPFRELAGTVHNFYEQIFNFWDCPISITNGFTECTNRIIRENNVKGRGNSFEILRGRTLFRNANLERISSNGMLLGPTIKQKGSLFFFEDVDEPKDTAAEDTAKDYDSFDYDPLIGLIPGVNYDPETGEIFDDSLFDEEEEEEENSNG